eukprot:GHVS01085034.1.p1 GENE.GHVS01085034.1~~GHVS01085034.1.p1  ORF type:complete len:400 (-),score=27.03 GHVS01085034.1:74-1273(-)
MPPTFSAEQYGDIVETVRNYNMRQTNTTVDQNSNSRRQVISNSNNSNRGRIYQSTQDQYHQPPMTERSGYQNIENCRRMEEAKTMPRYPRGFQDLVDRGDRGDQMYSNSKQPYDNRDYAVHNSANRVSGNNMPRYQQQWRQNVEPQYCHVRELPHSNYQEQGWNVRGHQQVGLARAPSSLSSIRSHLEPFLSANKSEPICRLTNPLDHRLFICWKYEDADSWVTQHVYKENVTIVGFDTETQPRSVSGPSLLQLSTLHATMLLRLRHRTEPVFGGGRCPAESLGPVPPGSALGRLLTDPYVLKVGMEMDIEGALLRDFLGLFMKGVLNLTDNDANGQKVGITRHARYWLNIEYEKKSPEIKAITRSDWECWRLSKEQIHYAAGDSWLSLLIHVAQLGHL